MGGESGASVEPRFDGGAAQPQAFPTLTDHEREILNLIAQGHPNPVIAKQLHLSPKTVGNYVSNIRAREAGLG